MMRKYRPPVAVVGHPTGMGSIPKHRTMPLMTTAGLKPCETTSELYTSKYCCHIHANVASVNGAAFDALLSRTDDTALSNFYANNESYDD